MSLRALQWALYEVHRYIDDIGHPGWCVHCRKRADHLEHVNDPLSRLVLILLADNADHDGHGAHLSKATLAKASGAGESTIYTRTRRLEAAGLLAPGDPEVVAGLPANARPKVWDLPRVSGVQHRHPRRRRGGADAAPHPRRRPGVQRGYSGGAAGVQPSAPKPLEPLEPLNPGAAAGGLPPAGSSTRAPGRHAIATQPEQVAMPMPIDFRARRGGER